MKASVTSNGKTYDADVSPQAVRIDDQTIPYTARREAGTTHVTLAGKTYEITFNGDATTVNGQPVPFTIETLDTAGKTNAAASGTHRVKPPMTGKLVHLNVSPGQAIEKGHVLFTLEAMKMLNEVRAATAGTVKAIHAKAGQTLEPNTVVLELQS